MLVQGKEIFQNSSLYGDFLTQLPSKVWDYTKKNPLYILYRESDPGKEKRFFVFFEQFYRTTYRSNGSIEKVEIGLTSPLIKYTELALHKCVGLFLTAGACAVAAPIGFLMKTIHYVAMSVFGKDFASLELPASVAIQTNYVTPTREELRRLRMQSGFYGSL